MARIDPINESQALPESAKELSRQRMAHGQVTDMKRTLAHSPLALRALMNWYPLHDEVAGFLGQRATTIFVHAISSETDCLICSTFFRRWLIDAGENPDALQLSDREQTIVRFGRQLARDANDVSDTLFAQLSAFLAEDQIVSLITFGGLMIATNVFNNALRVDLDDYLERYRKPEASEVNHAAAPRGLSGVEP
jgi:alkylhydroperoxidase family enzyme